MTVYYGNGGTFEASLNSLHPEQIDDAFFLKVVEKNETGWPTRKAYTTLSLDVAKTLHSDLGKLIEQFEAILPKPKTRQETIREFEPGTIFTTHWKGLGAKQTHIRLTGENVFHTHSGNVGEIGGIFSSGTDTDDIVEVEK